LSATAVGVARGAMKTLALGKKIAIPVRPQTSLPNDNLHALEPAGHGGMVFGKIKYLRCTIWECATAHAWTIRLACPPFPWSCE